MNEDGRPTPRRLDPREARYIEEARSEGREGLKEIANRKFKGMDPRELSQALERTERARVREEAVAGGQRRPAGPPEM